MALQKAASLLAQGGALAEAFLLTAHAENTTLPLRSPQQSGLSTCTRRSEAEALAEAFLMTAHAENTTLPLRSPQQSELSTCTRKSEAAPAEAFLLTLLPLSISAGRHNSQDCFSIDFGGFLRVLRFAPPPLPQVPSK